MGAKDFWDSSRERKLWGGEQECCFDLGFGRELDQEGEALRYNSKSNCVKSKACALPTGKLKMSLSPQKTWALGMIQGNSYGDCGKMWPCVTAPWDICQWVSLSQDWAWPEEGRRRTEKLLLWPLQSAWKPLAVLSFPEASPSRFRTSPYAVGSRSVGDNECWWGPLRGSWRVPAGHAS